jgi:site-specific recombinase XerD
VRKFGEKTQNDYIRHVKTFSTFLGRSPIKAKPEDLRRYQVHQSRMGVQPPTINGSVAALRFLFRVTLDRPELCRHLTMVPQPQKLPVVLSKEEVERLLEAAPGVKYKVALSVAYGAGLRVSEVANLKVSDIDSERMLILVEQGKGKLKALEVPVRVNHESPSVRGVRYQAWRYPQLRIKAPNALSHVGCRFSPSNASPLTQLFAYQRNVLIRRRVGVASD